MSDKKTNRDIRDYLNDISEMIGDIEDFTAGISYQNFRSDKKTLYAVIRCFEVLGEAVKHIPDHVRGEHPEIPWKGLAVRSAKLALQVTSLDSGTRKASFALRTAQHTGNCPISGVQSLLCK